MTSYKGQIRAKDGLLLGAVTIHTSSRFEDRKHAMQWAHNAAEVNAEAGRKVGDVRVFEVDGNPEIFKRDVIGFWKERE